MAWQLAQPFRYAVNGIVATAVHFGVLTFNLKVLQWGSAGAANLLAALFGIATSFLGSRFFVFSHTRSSLQLQALKFSGLYGCIALLHAAVLYFWTDSLHLDYRAGFLIATALQMVLSYFGNKFLVFNV